MLIVLWEKCAVGNIDSYTSETSVWYEKQMTVVNKNKNFQSSNI